MIIYYKFEAKNSLNLLDCGLLKRSFGLPSSSIRPWSRKIVLEEAGASAAAAGNRKHTKGREMRVAQKSLDSDAHQTLLSSFYQPCDDQS